jgi:hypothetical protein
VNYLSTLQLGLDEDVADKFHSNFEDFVPLDDFGVLDEQKRFLKLLNPTNKIIFRSNHASNALHLSGNLPKDKYRLINELDLANMIGNDALIPSNYRSF